MKYSEFFSCLRIKFTDCITEKCAEPGQGCKLNCNKERFNEFILFKGEKITEKLDKNIKICDCFIYCKFNDSDSLIIALVELKSTSIKPSEIKEKFVNSVEKAKFMIDSCNNINKTKIEFFPILLYKDINPFDSKTISNFKIRLQKESHIIREKCGSDLLKIIEDYK